MKKILPFLFRSLKAVIAFALIALILWRAEADMRRFTDLFSVYFLFACGAVLTQNLLTAVRWHAILRCLGIEISLFTALELTMQGIFCNMFIPAGSVGGDLAKAGLLALHLKEGQRLTGVLSIPADRLCGLTGLLLALLVILPFFPGTTAALCIAAAGLPVIALLLCYKIFLRVGWIRRIYDFFDRLTHGFFEKTAAVIDLCLIHWKTMLRWVLLSGFLFFPLYTLAYVFITCAVAGSATWDVLPAGLLGEFAGVLPLTPGGIGVRDAAASNVLLSGGGYSAGTAAIISTSFSLVLLCTSLVGGLFFAASQKKKK